MNDHVHWMLTLDIRDGQLEPLKALMEEMVAATEANEPGTLNYEWYLSEDGKTCHLYERYVDSAAVMIHLKSFGEKFAERFMGCVQPSGFVVYGNPDQTVRDALADFGPAWMAPIGGFAR